MKAVHFLETILILTMCKAFCYLLLYSKVVNVLKMLIVAHLNDSMTHSSKIKLLEKCIRNIELGIEKDFINKAHKILTIKEKTDKFDFC